MFRSRVAICQRCLLEIVLDLKKLQSRWYTHVWRSNWRWNFEWVIFWNRPDTCTGLRPCRRCPARWALPVSRWRESMLARPTSCRQTDGGRWLRWTFAVARPAFWRRAPLQASKTHRVSRRSWNTKTDVNISARRSFFSRLCIDETLCQTDAVHAGWIRHYNG